MRPVIAVHPSPGSWSDRWIAGLRDRGLEPLLVNALSSDLLVQLRGADAFLWHWFHGDPAAWLVARGLFAACHAAGIPTVPDLGSALHFDDKIAQKHLFDAIEAPAVPTWVFTDRDEALDWVASATFPKVWKLRRGAGSSNVRLVRTRAEAEGLVRQAFGKGFDPAPALFDDAATKARNTRDLAALAGKIKRLPGTLATLRARRAAESPERGYAYFQELVPDNLHDVRVTVIGDRAFTFRRGVRPGDFRASGSGDLRHVQGPEEADLDAVREAFSLARRLGSPSLAFDFLVAPGGKRLVVEMSYAYLSSAVHGCAGHFTPDLAWVPGHVWPEEAILEDLLARLATMPRGSRS